MNWKPGLAIACLILALGASLIVDRIAIIPMFVFALASLCLAGSYLIQDRSRSTAAGRVLCMLVVAVLAGAVALALWFEG